MRLEKLLRPFMAALLALAVAAPVMADDDERGERHEGRSPATRVDLTPKDTLYSQECSSCHFLYLPGLLTARSWEKVVNESDKHFGENLGLDEKTANGLLAYLKANSADKAQTKWARRIADSSGDTAYARIMDVPWVKKEHREIREDVFKRPSIGSRSNCGACHPEGSKGDFEEDNVRIPKK